MKAEGGEGGYSVGMVRSVAKTLLKEEDMTNMNRVENEVSQWSLSPFTRLVTI